LSPLEFVDTMGALYQHAGASGIPVDVTRRHLRLELTRRLALPSATPDADLARIAGERLQFDGPSFLNALNRATSTPKEALALVQDLEHYVARALVRAVSRLVSTPVRTKENP
jgi:hypothetical protein